MRWNARYVDASTNAVVERGVEADTAEQVRQDLMLQGHVPVTVHAEWFALVRHRAMPIDLRSFCLEFRALLVAGLGIVEALAALAAAQRRPNHRASIERALQRIKEGKALSAALAAAPADFPPIFRAAVSAAESSGRLPESLERFSQYLESMARLRQSIVTASIYPGLVVTFGLGVVLFLLAFVIPRFATAYESLPEIASRGAGGLLLTAATSVSRNFELVLIGFIGALWAAWRFMSSAYGRHAVWRALVGFPPLARAIRAYWLSRLFRTVSMMLEGGYTLPEAMRLGRQVVESTPWAADVERALEQVTIGKGVANAFRAAGLTQDLTSRLLAAGEASGNLAEMLRHAAEHHERELAWFVERASRVVEPALLILVAGIIGVIVLMMYMPIFDLASALG
ncbi:type II secretion system F family protein [Betaproteobacteria bacterium PRO7]|jgi:general secretion pathway protein F|nr:type II secretion system F family protein [Betaproteobacteria bacterium PRO7]